jgi:TrpR-related protein YerC/YecD
MKIKPRKTSNQDRIKYLDTLYTALSSLKSREEIKGFLKDLLTESEKIMLGRRILIAQMLLQDAGYDEIIKQLHVGADTIMRIHRWLEDERDGYEKAVLNLEKEFNKRISKKESQAEPCSFTWLRKKYPMHFLLFNLFSDKK